MKTYARKSLEGFKVLQNDFFFCNKPPRNNHQILQAQHSSQIGISGEITTVDDLLCSPTYVNSQVSSTEVDRD